MSVQIRLMALAGMLALGLLWHGDAFAAADEAKKYYSQGMTQASQGKYDAAAESLRKAI